VRNNPEIRAANNEAEAARQRVSPAGALDDPMLEAGLVNVPTDSWRLNREDMTMKMLGLAQRFPFPGKRALRREVAERDAETAEQGYRETVNRVARDVKLTYLDLALALESVRLSKDTTLVLEQFLRIVESRYAVGQGAQADVFKAQTQLAKMREELLRMERERPVMEAELAMLLGRAGAASIAAPLPGTPQLRLELESLRETALRQRPQLLALRKVVEKNNASIALARKEYNPDFDVRLSYGQRESMPDGTKRPDMVSLMVAINLPIWGRDKVDPRIAEARSMRDQAQSMYHEQHNDVFAKLRQQVAIAEQSRKSAELYDTAILPQARLAVESALSAYRVNRVDLLMLLDSQMSLFNFGIGRAAAVVSLNKALAEIGLLTGAQQI
jgi:outer membrane protein TolC